MACGTALLAPPAEAAFRTGLSGPEYTDGSASVRARWFDETVNAGAGIVRINVLWRAVVSGRPADPGNPADPAYEFSALDAAVREAAARDLDVLLSTYDAPPFAEGANRPASAPPGTWKPDPKAYGAFARALATRYSGNYQGLARVRYFQAWNEPNLSGYITPQWDGGSLFAARHYREMLNAFEAAVHAVRRDNVVVTAGTAPFGDPPGGERTRPLRFWRQVLCLKQRRGQLAAASCPTKARFDILAHHPINTSGGPRRSALHPDDASTPDFKHVRATLRAAERLGRVAGRHPLWATEIWWESDPPDGQYGVNLSKHARWYAESLYLLWKQGAGAVINLLVRDGPYDPQDPGATIEAGLFFNEGTPKPALRAFRFPFVVDPRGQGGALAWGRSPARGQLEIQRHRKGGWRTVKRLKVRAGGVFTAKLRSERGTRLRARVAGESSLTWRVGR